MKKFIVTMVMAMMLMALSAESFKWRYAGGRAEKAFSPNGYTVILTDLGSDKVVEAARGRLQYNIHFWNWENDAARFMRNIEHLEETITLEELQEWLENVEKHYDCEVYYKKMLNGEEVK